MKISLCVAVSIVCVLLLTTTTTKAQDPLEVLSSISSFACTDWTSNNADTLGRMAAGRDCKLVNYEVRGLPEKNCTDAALICGRDLSLTSGQVTNGRAFFGRTLQSTAAGFVCGTVNSNPVNFPHVCTNLNLRALNISGLAPNGTVTGPNIEGEITLTGTYNKINVFSLSSARLKQAVSLSLSIPASAWAIINIDGKENSLVGVEFHLSPQTNKQKVLWNFYDTANLRLDGLSVKGSLLAINAVTQFDNGNIDGSIAVYSNNGTGEVHYFPYIPPPCICPPCHPCPPNITLPDFNVFARLTVQLDNTDVEGRMAAGSSVSVSNFAVGVKLTPSTARNDLLVGGDLSFNKGSVNNGGVVVQGSATYVSVNVFGSKKDHTPTGIDFNSQFSQLSSLSRQLNQLVANGGVSASGTTLTLTGSSPLSVFKLTQSQFEGASEIFIKTPANAYAIVNVAGSTIKLVDKEITLTGCTRHTTLYNFQGATSLTINGVSVQGSVLASTADVEFSNGNVEGGLYCNSVQGNGESHYFPFTPYAPPCPPCPPCEC